MKDITATARTQVLRLPQRAVYDREVIHAILDEGFICHVGFAVDGQPYVIPTAYGRGGDSSTCTGRRPAACCGTSRTGSGSASR